MIEVTLDFGSIGSIGELAQEISGKLRFKYPMDTIRSWDAYIDLFSDLMYKEFDSEYSEKDGWIDYQEYLDYIEEDKSVGQKNEEGVRDNLKLVFVNFYSFYWRHRGLAKEFLECTMFAITRKEEADDDEKKDLLKIELYIKS